MGFISLGSIGKSIFNGIKSVGGEVLKAVAPKAADLLKNIVGSGFDAVKGMASNFVNSLPLPSPLKALGEKLLGKGADFLKGLAGKGIDTLFEKVGLPTSKPVAGAPAGTAVTTPGLGTVDRAGSAAAATAAANDVISQVTGKPAPSTGSIEDDLANRAAGLKEPTMPPEGASEGEMAKYQAALQKYSRMMDMYTKLIQANHDMKKNIIANFRV